MQVAKAESASEYTGRKSKSLRHLPIEQTGYSCFLCVNCPDPEPRDSRVRRLHLKSVYIGQQSFRQITEDLPPGLNHAHAEDPYPLRIDVHNAGDLD